MVAKSTKPEIKTSFGLKCKSPKAKEKKGGKERKTGPGCVILAVKPVQRPGLSEWAQTSPLSTESTLEMPKTPGFTSSALPLERIFVFSCLVEEVCPPRKRTTTATL
jgi:hypothetical protein